ncbi:MAG: hypothetical protein ACE15D_05215 [Candidatus Eisenbacteria bacterium]
MNGARMPAAAVFALLACLSGQALAGSGPAPAPAPGLPPAADSLARFLDALGAASDSSFSSETLAPASLEGVDIDSIVAVYRATGLSPAEKAKRSRGSIRPGLRAIRYDRVEGLHAMGNLAIRPPGTQGLRVDAGIGYATASEETTWRGAAEQTVRLGERSRLDLDAVAKHDLRSYGSGGVPLAAAMALLYGLDEEDYFLATGVWTGFGLSNERRWGSVHYRYEEQESAANETRFSLFRGNHGFRPNPPIDDVTVRSIEMAIGMNQIAGPQSFVRIEAAIAGRGLGGDADYRSLRADLRLARTVVAGDEVVVRVAAGGVDPSAPYQALHHLGGYALLRAYEVNEFHTRRFVHFGFDDLLGTDLFRPIPLLGRLKIQLAPFFDAAAFEEAAPGESNEAVWRFSTGLGLQKNLLQLPGGGGQLRLEIGRRLDRSEDAMRYRFTVTGF